MPLPPGTSPSFGDRRRLRPVPASEFPCRLACADPVGSPRAVRHARCDLGRAAQGLQYDAIALSQLQEAVDAVLRLLGVEGEGEDRKSTRLNSSHSQISY